MKAPAYDGELILSLKSAKQTPLQPHWLPSVMHN